MKFTKEWLQAALTRAIWTAAQVALGMFTIGMTVHEVDWAHIVSVAVVAAVYSMLTSVVRKLPELEKDDLIPDGSLVIDGSDPDVYSVLVNLGNKTMEEVAEKKQVILDVKNGSVLDEENSAQSEK